MLATGNIRCSLQVHPDAAGERRGTKESSGRARCGELLLKIWEATPSSLIPVIRPVSAELITVPEINVHTLLACILVLVTLVFSQTTWYSDNSLLHL